MVKTLISVIIAWAAVLPCAAFAGNGLSYSGSSTIGMGILEAGAMKAFEDKTGVGFTSVEMPGSGKGIRALLDNRATVAGVSRELTQKEKDGGLIGTVIGYDAIAVFVNSGNAVKDLSMAELKGIFTGKIKNWMQVGGTDGAIEPNTEIAGEKRATMVAFQEMAMDSAPYGRGFRQIDFPRDQISETAGNKHAICTVSMGLRSRLSAFLRNKVRVVAVNGVEPTEAAILSGAYALSRPLLLVTRGKPRGEAKKFIAFMLSAEGQKKVGINFVRAEY